MPDGQKPPARRKTTQELLAEEEKKGKELRARIEELKARQRTEERKKENHRKIIVGSAVLAHIKINPAFRKEVQEALNKSVTDPKHREAIKDVLSEKAFATAMKEAARLAKIAAQEIGDGGGEGGQPPA